MDNLDGRIVVPRTAGLPGGGRNVVPGSAKTRATASAPETETQRPAEPASATKLLEHLADQAMEYPPKDIHVLTASVQKFLLTDLEPALRMARELRQELHSGGDRTLEIITEGRQSEAISLLGG